MESITLEELEIDAIKNPVLKNRAQSCSESIYTKFFVAKLNQSEVGFLAVDFIPPPQTFVIYQLFVLEDYRRRGVGTELLQKAEDMALNAGNNIVRLEAKPLDAIITRNELRSFYKKRGYHPETGSEYFEKIIQ